MKNASGELSLTSIVMIAIAAISASTIFILNNGFNKMMKLISVTSEDKSTVVTSNSKEIPIDNITIISGDTYSSDQNKSLTSLLSNMTYSSNSISNEIKKELEKKTEKNLRKIHNHRATCINSCGDYNKTKKLTYYQTNTGYIVKATDSANNSYSMNYELKKNILGQEKYKMTFIYNDEKSKNNAKKIIDSAKKAESTSEELDITYDYDENYISEANALKNATFSDEKDNTYKVYNQNINSLVVLNSYSDGKIVNNANGFFLTSEIIATSWSYVLTAIKDNSTITALTANNTNYSILGVVTMDEKTDIALLKVATPNNNIVSLGSIKSGEETLLLSSTSGFGFSGRVGVNIGSNATQTTVIYSSKENLGSPLYNNKGQVVGIITNNEEVTNLTSSISSNILKKYQDYYINIDSNYINYYELNYLQKKYYSLNVKTENIQNIITYNKLWKKYQNLIDLSSLGLDMTKFNSNFEETIITLRYKNKTNIDNNIILSSFIKTLIDNNYKEVINSNKKKKYLGDCEITIYYEFDYIILIVKEV